MMKRLHKVLAWAMALLLAAPIPVRAQSEQPAPFTAEQLDQLAAPIALYPDPLLAQIMMAATYPLEIVQAARFVKANQGLSGAKLDEALKNETWDDSVKSLVTFPQVLDMLDGKLDWTQKLGDAFLAQQKELMDAVQRLRAKAQAAGNLKSTPEQTVAVEPAAAAPPPAQPAAPGQQVVVQQAPAQIITIQPTNPQVVYVPTYNPTVVYGAWPYPAYPPYAYYPPGYVAGAAMFSFAAGVAVGGALWGGCNWGRGEVNVNVNNYNNFTKNVNQTNIAQKRTEMQGNRQNWQHNPEHRKGAQYRDTATQQRFDRGGNAQAAQSREAFRGRAEQGRQDLSRGGGDRGAGMGQRGGAGAGPNAGQLGGAGTGGQRGGGAGGGLGGERGGGGLQGGASAQPRTSGGSAFQGMGQGRDVQSSSNRGQSSRQSMSAQPRGGGSSRPTGGGGGSRGGRR
jgi:hypothetical protein